MANTIISFYGQYNHLLKQNASLDIFACIVQSGYGSPYKLAMSIYYFVEFISFRLKQKKKISKWLQDVVEEEGYKLEQLNFIFCSDCYLHAHNRNYLGHDALTDVITFDYAVKEKTIWGDIYISIERVKENAKVYQEIFQVELYRVMVHGLLHLLAYNDHTPEEKTIIQAQESYYLNQLLPLLE